MSQARKRQRTSEAKSEINTKATSNNNSSDASMEDISTIDVTLADASTSSTASASASSAADLSAYLLAPTSPIMPRIGASFQVATLPTASPSIKSPGTAAASSSSSLTSSRSPIEGSAVWLGSRITDQTKLAQFLHTVSALFHHSTEHYDEELALELLHRCQYDMHSCTELLQPWAKIEEDGDDANNGGKAEFESDDMCNVCGDGGDLIICDTKGCKRVYHAVCAELSEVPSGTWECPVHFCQTCGIRVTDAQSIRCTRCPTSFCNAHIPADGRSAAQIKHSDFKCPRCSGSPESTNNDRRGFLIQLQAALTGAQVPQTGKSAEYHSAPINLKELYREITVRGGLEEVLTTAAWKDIQRLFFHPIAQPKAAPRREK